MRDSVDQRIVDEVIGGTGRIIDHPSQVGGWPAISNGAPPDDSDLDGMPDNWETSQGLNPNDPADGAADADGNGYTNVEEYLNSLAPETGPRGNLPPLVSAGADQAIRPFDNATLDGTISDDGLPNPPAGVTAKWTVVSGPGVVTFGDPDSVDTTASFSDLGAYVLELSGTDGEMTTSDRATITVNTSSGLLVPADYPTIQAAIDAAQDGDLVLVSPGTYVESLNLNKAITLKAQQYDPVDPRNNVTIIDGGGADSVIEIPAGVNGEPHIIGFKIQNAASDGITPSSPFVVEYSYFTGAGDLIDYEEGSGGICRGNVFENADDDALDLDHQVQDLLIENNEIINSGEDGIEIRLHDDTIPEQVTVTIRHNAILGSGGDGIQLIDYSDDTNRQFVIEHNLFSTNAFAAMGLMDNEETHEDFRAASIRERIRVFNNTFVGNDHGISGGDNLIALNNLFVDSTNVALKGVDADSIAAYNLFWNNGLDFQTSNVDNTTTLFTDPLLDGNNQLQDGSPAIDAGTAFFEHSGETVLDLAPATYSGAAPDLGKYESTPSLTLQSIAVSPGNASVEEGQTQQFTAMGTYSDSSTQDMTTAASWSSSNTAVATVDGLGLASGNSSGGSNITAAMDGITSNTAALTVSTSPAISLSADGFKVKGKHHANLVWNGATSVTIDIVRNGVLIITTPNDGTHDDNIGKRGGKATYTYQVCEAGTSVCSNTARAVF